tara:strand:+ start:875 stop:1138 length:264 start_codon:yes stop_codon:yes gene_type:complete
MSGVGDNIKAVDEKNLAELLPLKRQDQDFYQIADISDECNRQFFSRFGIDNPFGCQFLYRQKRASDWVCHSLFNVPLNHCRQGCHNE